MATEQVTGPRDVAELDTDTLADKPRRRKHLAELVLELEQTALDPRVAPIDLVQPRHLSDSSRNSHSS